jgi:hypothetical protein
MIEVTIGVLIYKSQEWLDFVLTGIYLSKPRIPFSVQVLANDPTIEIAQDPRVNEVFSNPDRNEFYLKRVYRAWNHLVATCPTKYIVLMNSDMFPSAGWLDRLYAYRDFLPTSLLVESGRILSAFPEYVRPFSAPKGFDIPQWESHARNIAKPAVSPGRLYMPVLFSVEEFLATGGYPEGNVGDRPGDAWFFEQYTKKTGKPHLTILDSVVYHHQEGEMRE